MRRWTEEEIEYLIENYSDNKSEDLSKKINRSCSAIYRKGRELGLSKSKKHISNMTSIRNKMVSEKWSDDEINFLIENYPNNKNKDLSKKMNRSLDSINRKSSSLGLKKTKEHKSKILSERNKIIGRDLTYDRLKKIASRYKTRGQFQYCDNSAYTTSRRRGILDEICSHMIKQSYSIPQLICKFLFDNIVGEKCHYNTKKIIPPYELDLFYPSVNLAIEYNGKGWHDENDNTNLKVRMCEEIGILLIIIKENNRRYEEDIKKQIINNIDLINNKLDKKIEKESLLSLDINPSIFNNILDDDYIISITKKYINYSEFRKNEINLYNKLQKLKQLDKYTSHMKRNRIYWDSDKLKKVISKYGYLKDLIENDFGCYCYIKKHKEFDYLLLNLKRIR